MRHHKAKRIVETALNTLAFASLVRWIGPRRLVRVAALATEGALGEAGRRATAAADTHETST
jgi:hypothetical protein